MDKPLERKMTIKFAVNIAFDIFIYFCFWTIFKEGPYADYAENIVLFVFWMQAIVGLGLLFVFDPKTKHDLHSQMKRGKTHLMYGYVTLLIEIIVLAALGHPVLAFFYLFGGVNMMQHIKEANSA